MSQTISLTAADVVSRLSRLGLECRFADGECADTPSAPLINVDAKLFGFPTPQQNSGITLSKIKDLAGTDPARQPSFFDHPWFRDEEFMRTPCPAGWHFLTMEVLPDSVGQPSDYGRVLAGRGFEVPKAVEVVLMLFLHYLGTGEQLLFRKHTWCADRASEGRVVTVGAFGRNGVFLSAHPPGFGSRGLGICAKVA